MFLRQSTSQTIRFGPFLDDTDFKTAETGLTVAQADRQLSKDGGAFAQSNHTGNSTHDTDGWYSDDLDATDTNTVGELILQVVVAGALPVWVRYWVIEEAVYDAMYGASAAGPLQSTTAGRTLDVTAGGTAGIDWGNVENPTTAVDLSATDIQLADTVTTLTGHTAQTGDSFARLGAPAGASVSADVAAVKTDTAAILTDTADMQPKLGTITDLGGGATVGNNLSDMAGGTFSSATDSQEAIRNRGDAAWTTAVGFSTHSAADVWAVGTRALTDKAGFSLAADQSGVTVGTVNAIAGTIGTLDALDTAQDTQHASTQADIAALNDLSAAQVNAEMVDVITVDTISELSQAQPASTPTVATALMLLYMALRNKLDTTSSTLEVHNDAGTVIAKKALSDDGTTYSEAKMASGP